MKRTYIGVATVFVGVVVLVVWLTGRMSSDDAAPKVAAEGAETTQTSAAGTSNTGSSRARPTLPAGRPAGPPTLGIPKRQIPAVLKDQKKTAPTPSGRAVAVPLARELIPRRPGRQKMQKPGKRTKKTAQSPTEKALDKAYDAYAAGDYELARKVASALADGPTRGDVRVNRLMIATSCRLRDDVTAEAHLASLPAEDAADMRSFCSSRRLSSKKKPKKPKKPN